MQHEIQSERWTLTIYNMNVSCPEACLTTPVIECEFATIHNPITEVGVVHLVEDLPRESNGDAAQLLPLGRLVELGTILGCSVDMR